MKIKKQFILREVVGEAVLIPTGDTALEFNGIIGLNPVGAVIWKGLAANKTQPEILTDILAEFDVDEARARTDLADFLQLLKKNHILELE